MMFDIFGDIKTILNQFKFRENLKWSIDSLNYKISTFFMASLLLSIFYLLIISYSNIAIFAPIAIVLFEGYIHKYSEKAYYIKEDLLEEQHITSDDLLGSQLIGLAIIYIIKIFATLVGTLLFILPGMYFYIRLSMVRHAYVYYDCSLSQAFVKGWKITRGNFIKLLLLYSMMMFLIGFIIIPYLFLFAILMSLFPTTNTILLGIYSLPLLVLLVMVHHVLLQSIKTRIFMDTILEREEVN